MTPGHFYSIFQMKFDQGGSGNQNLANYPKSSSPSFRFHWTPKWIKGDQTYICCFYCKLFFKIANKIFELNYQ